MDEFSHKIAALTDDPTIQRQIATLLQIGSTRFLTVTRAAFQVGVSRRTIERALARGELKRWRPAPGIVRIDRGELIEWFAAKYPILVPMSHLAEVSERGGLTPSH